MVGKTHIMIRLKMGASTKQSKSNILPGSILGGWSVLITAGVYDAYDLTISTNNL
jgi:hypothetical protein